ncbi:hypothetical protein [Porphyromonas asaccharolytica]|uniref:Heat shock protein DnaJ domain protein n=1 Tax=Porphyromonas asaccharolytica (strain ATCC 25260 / DSM 20707 / BCRC 10618 / CCUG 7834 / JCM 6326 / LMG 13178 / VPI 4198 / B440) TaxID=879243 RepID=F4KJR4_PORAD|nr:hypothetical protein [Porphyromonas asaccharolytica]AEE12641.1 heat shock protein DnaJ domain protein [Porphyromonas asaccharolytica DSM 20707]EFR34365.1 DnaJ domain protein [Porphyromonas asaccharolytica PR426713P-I]
MTDMNPLACSPEYQRLREQYETLVVAYTALVSQYQEMTDHEAPHLSALYMHYFGKLLYTQLRLGLSLATLRLRRSLLQAYINRDEAPDLVEIDKQMAQQRLEFHQLLEKKLAQLKAAKEYWDRPHLSSQETKELKEIYKALVKRLHPDLNPHYTEEDKRLFLITVKAYQIGDLPQLRALLALLNKEKPQEELPSDPEALLAEVEKLQEKKSTLEIRIAKRSESFPFDQKELLSSPVAILKKQAELEAIIQELQTSEKEQQTIVTLMEEYKSHNL